MHEIQLVKTIVELEVVVERLANHEVVFS